MKKTYMVPIETVQNLIESYTMYGNGLEALRYGIKNFISLVEKAGDQSSTCIEAKRKLADDSSKMSDPCLCLLSNGVFKATKPYQSGR